MTDREKLIKLIQTSPADIMGNHGIGNMADHLIANGVTVQRWTPVTERLPDKDGYYLAWIAGSECCEALGFAKDGREVCAYDFRYNWENVWYDYDSEWGFVSYDVTHWMPLPEPPKEGKDNA